MMLCKNMKRIVHSIDRDTDFFNIDTGDLQKTTSTILVYTIRRLRTPNINKSINLIKLMVSHLKKGRKQTISCRNYDKHNDEDNFALFTSLPA